MKKNSSVSIKNLHFAYDTHNKVLSGLSLEIAAGERLGIIGPSGAGKSTLLLHLNGILAATSGKIEIDGLKVEKKNLKQVRRKVGIVFQNPDDQLFNPTVEEDIAFGPLNMGCDKITVQKRIKEVLDPLHLAGFEKKISHHLSFGERKRVALATVLAMRPSVLGFDEPFSNLEPHLVKHLIAIIKKIPATTIIISQSIIPVLACCDKLAILNNGRIIACDETRKIASDRKLLQSCNLDFHYYLDICKEMLT